MRTILVPGVAIQIPVLGFGCSALSSVGGKKALGLLGAAFDAGVRHFDVARYYGYGESEGILEPLQNRAARRLRLRRSSESNRRGARMRCDLPCKRGGGSCSLSLPRAAFCGAGRKDS